MSALVMPSSGHHTLSGFEIATPATFTRSALTVRPGDLARGFVRSKSEEGRLPELAVGRPLRERELRHKGWTHPCRIPLAGSGLERRTHCAQPREPSRQIGERVAREARSDLPDVAQPPVVEQSDQERAEMLARAFRRGESADDELGFLPDLDLEPRVRARPGPVRRAIVLRDDAFPPETFRLAV